MTNSYKADTTNNTVNEYFDLHTTGVGYVNRIRCIFAPIMNTYSYAS